MKVINNLDLTPYNAYKVKSTCAEVYFPDDELDFLSLYSSEANKDFVVIGNGNNIIFAKDYYAQPFIILNNCLNKIKIENDFVIAEAGATLLDISLKALEYQLSGFEAFYDIPGSVGGAVVMNAGNKKTEIKDILVKVRYLDLNTLEIKEKYNADLDFSYRDSFFQKEKNNIVLKAWFKLTPDDYKKIQVEMESEKKTRWSKQPREFPNCGSVFKRPKNMFVGPMLDELNLKGFSIGGAQISEKHSGFIVNTGGATGQDILALIDEVKIRVKSHFDVELEIEQRVIF